MADKTSSPKASESLGSRSIQSLTVGQIMRAVGVLVPLFGGMHWVTLQFLDDQLAPIIEALKTESEESRRRDALLADLFLESNAYTRDLLSELAKQGGVDVPQKPPQLLESEQAARALRRGDD